MKPKIFKKGNFWVVRHHYPPRMFSLFGANMEERRHIQGLCIQDIPNDSWKQAITYLAHAYADCQVNRF